MKNILLIGCGHMGHALLTSWTRPKTYSITVIDPIKFFTLKKRYIGKYIEIKKNISDLNKFNHFDFIVFAIKPNDLKNVLTQMSKIKFSKKTAIISVIAGKKIKIFEDQLKQNKNIFRVMPNMPASISESMNCIVANKKTNKRIIKEVVKLFSYSGKTQILKYEKEIDMATAISGSGPGFVFNLIDAMEKAAINLGFNKNIASILVHQTFKGSINLLLKNNMTARELVNTVATKGGTTEAGLKIMKKNKIHKIFKDLTKSSYKKAKDQGN